MMRNCALISFSSVCCRSPIVPVRPTYSAELLTASMNGSLPRSSGASGSAPDLSSNGATPTHQPHHGNGTPGGRRSRADSRASPTVTTNSAILSGTHHGTNVWSNPLNWNDDNGSTSTTPTPTMASMHGLVGGGGGEEGLLLLRHQECYSAAAANHAAGSGFAPRFAPSPPPPIPPPPTSSVRAAHPTGPAVSDIFFMIILLSIKCFTENYFFSSFNPINIFLESVHWHELDVF